MFYLKEDKFLHLLFKWRMTGEYFARSYSHDIYNDDWLIQISSYLTLQCHKYKWKSPVGRYDSFSLDRESVQHTSQFLVSPTLAKWRGAILCVLCWAGITHCHSGRASELPPGSTPSTVANLTQTYEIYHVNQKWSEIFGLFHHLKAVTTPLIDSNEHNNQF